MLKPIQPHRFRLEVGGDLYSLYAVRSLRHRTHGEVVKLQRWLREDEPSLGALLANASVADVVAYAKDREEVVRRFRISYQGSVWRPFALRGDAPSGGAMETVYLLEPTVTDVTTKEAQDLVTAHDAVRRAFSGKNDVAGRSRTCSPMPHVAMAQAPNEQRGDVVAWSAYEYGKRFEPSPPVVETHDDDAE